MVQIFLSLHVAQIAGRGHRPRWLAFGLLLTVVACFLFALPHFVYGEGSSNANLEFLHKGEYKLNDKGIFSVYLNKRSKTFRSPKISVGKMGHLWMIRSTEIETANNELLLRPNSSARYFSLHNSFY